MAEKSNVIDFVARKASQNKTQENAQSKNSDVNVLDMSKRRQEMLKEERRQVRRTILTEFIGAYVVVPGKGLQKVALYDISESGLSFDLEMKQGKFVQGEEIAMRVYLAHSTYFPISVKITNVRDDEDEQVYRHGVVFEKDTINNEALGHFVKFLESVSASLRSDHGDVLVSNLRS